MSIVIPPPPSKQDPFCQIKWIANICAEGYDNKHSADNPKSVVTPYIDYLIKTRGNSFFHIEIEWDELELIKFGDDLIERSNKSHPNHISSYTRKGYYCALKMLMKKAYILNIIDSIPIDIAHPKITKARPETDVNTAFDEARFRIIQKVINNHCRLSKLKALNPLQPYIKQNIGTDPRKKYGHWKSFESIIWYFEHIMDCIPHRAKTTLGDHDPHTNFFFACRKYHNGIESVYQKLGVETFSSRIGIDFIAPLAHKLAIETGFNVEVLNDLQVDCFVDAHELTGSPYIQYTKNRSGGDKELHIALLEDKALYAQQISASNLVNDEKSDYLWLNSHKTKKIQGILNTIISITKPIRNRDNTPDEYKNRLFLFEILKNRSRRKKIEAATISQSGSYSEMLRWKKEKLIPDIIIELVNQMKLTTPEPEWTYKEKAIVEEISNESFSIGKFRATVATNMVIKGAPLEVVQAWLGHNAMTTTILYIDRHHLKVRYQKEVTKSLNTIKENTVHFYRKTKLPIATTLQSSSKKVRYENCFSYCLNPMDPPNSVKKSKHWNPGTPCLFWNMCLFCDHILVTPDSLPKIIAYKWRILTLIDSGHGQKKENDIYMKTLFTINSILESDMFSKQELDAAKQLAEIYTETEMDAHMIAGVEKCIQ